jgi:rRNA-processing protein FCF1
MKIIADTNIWIRARFHLIAQNEQLQGGKGSPFYPIIKKGKILQTQPLHYQIAEEIANGWDSWGNEIDCLLLAHAKVYGAKMITFDKPLATQCRAHNVPVKELNQASQAIRELQKIGNKRILTIPDCQFYEFKKYGFGV